MLSTLATFLRKVLRCIVYGATALLLLSCGESASAGPRLTWITRWLESPVCQPPCWELLTPGETTTTQAMDILRQIPEVTDLSGPYESYGNQTEINWHFGSAPGGGMALFNSQGLLTQTLLSLPNGQVTVGEVVSVYGSPSHIVLKSTSERVQYYEADVIYLPAGQLLSIYKRGSGGVVRVSPDDAVLELVFFQPGDDGYANTVGAYRADTLARLLPWNGYGKYPYSP